MARYLVGRDGTIVSTKTGKVLKTHTCKKGYHRVNLKPRGVGVKLVHRIVAEIYIPNPDNLPQVNHKDGNKDNNSVDNLEWVDNLTNTRHAVANGLIPLGDERPNAKFSDEDIKMIRAMKEDWPSLTYYELADLWECSYQTIHKIITKQTYKHVM